jgi:hypothetical protein
MSASFLLLFPALLSLGVTERPLFPSTAPARLGILPSRDFVKRD